MPGRNLLGDGQDPLKETLRNFVDDLRELRTAIVEAGEALATAKEDLIDRINEVERRLTTEIHAIRLEREARITALQNDHIVPLKLQVKGISALYGFIGACVPIILSVIYHLLRK